MFFNLIFKFEKLVEKTSETAANLAKRRIDIIF